MSTILAQFSISRSDDEYVLQLEDEDGELMEFTASFDQLDLMSEAIDEQLNADEEDILGVDEEPDKEDQEEEEE